MRTTSPILSTVASCWFLAGVPSGAAHAGGHIQEQPATQAMPEVRWRAPLELVVDGKGAAFNIKAHPANATLVWVPRGVKEWSMPLDRGFSVRRWGDNALYVTVTRDAPVGSQAGLRIWSDDYQCSLHLLSVENLSDITRQDSIVVKHGDDKRRELEEQALRTQERAAEEQAVIPRDAGEKSRIVAEDRLARDILPRLRPEFAIKRLSDDAVEPSFIDAQWIGHSDLLLGFRADNPALQPSALYYVTGLDRHGAMLDIDVIYRTKDEDRARGRIATIGIDEHIQGGILIRNAADRDLAGMHIEFHGLVGAHHATAVGEISYFRAIPESELEDERRDREARGRVTLQVQPMFGAIWLENPLEPGDLDATSIKGIGVRVGYGFNRFFAVEGELIGASSGEASFSGTWNGASGSAMRDATLGRAQFGGVLRLGYHYIPTLRLGIGVQGANHGTSFAPDGADVMPGPDGGFEVDAFFGFGAGFDVRLGRHWTTGVMLSFVSGFKEESRSVQGGLHLSYSWKPGRSDEP